MDKKFKQLTKEPFKIRLGFDTKLPYEFDLYWDYKVMWHMIKEQNWSLTKEQIRLLAQHGYDVQGFIKTYCVMEG